MCITKLPKRLPTNEDEKLNVITKKYNKLPEGDPERIKLYDKLKSLTSQ